MIRRFAGLLLLPVVALAAATEENRLPNGDFEKGAAKATKIPAWTEVDGLTTFFESEKGHGRVLKIDTDVNLTDANERWEEMEKPAAERPAAKPKSPTKEPYYDTVGGTTGAKIYSDYLRVEPGMRYRLRADVRSTGPVVKVFVKGYAKFQGRFRKFYQCYLNVTEATGNWKTWERTFNPTVKSPKVTHIRVMPYAYWPVGQAYVDRVRVERVGPEPTKKVPAGKELIVNGTFVKHLAPWTADGDAGCVLRGPAGGHGRIGSGGALVSGPVEVEEGRGYVFQARVKPEGAVLSITLEGLVVLGGETHVLYRKKSTAPPSDDGWIDVEFPFHPTEETPQVTAVRIRFAVPGGKGQALVDDVSVVAAPEKEEAK